MEEVRRANRSFFATPWLQPDPQAALDTMTRDELAALLEAEPPGVCARHRTSPFYPPHVPDLAPSCAAPRAIRRTFRSEMRTAPHAAGSS
jgi:hypothetical protein